MRRHSWCVAHSTWAEVLGVRVLTVPSGIVAADSGGMIPLVATGTETRLLWCCRAREWFTHIVEVVGFGVPYGCRNYGQLAQFGVSSFPKWGSLLRRL